MLAYLLFEGRPLTTRGRWLNPLVLAGHGLWLRLPFGGADLRPIFILGIGRSGSTVLGTILALHRDVGYLNEPKALWHAALGDDDLIGSYSSKPGRYRMDADDADPVKLHRLRQSYRAFLRLSLSRRVVDKYPELIFRTGLLDTAFPAARMIVLLRNGADTIQSIANWSATHATAGATRIANWWGQERRKWHLLVTQLVAPDPYFAGKLAQIRRLRGEIDMAAVEWIVTMREALRLQQEAPGGLLLIRYEDLTAAPEKTLTQIGAFCGLAPDTTMLAYGAAVLRPGRCYRPPVLDPTIAPLFNGTMHALGYGGSR